MSEEEIKPLIGHNENPEPSQKKEISIPECAVHSVVVYPDRAEVSGFQFHLSSKLIAKYSLPCAFV